MPKSPFWCFWWEVNWEKSHLVPSIKNCHLGFELDTLSMTATLPQEKIDRLRDEHACQIEVLTPIKTPVLSMPERLITQITSQNSRAALEKNGECWASITQGINHHHKSVRTVKIKEFITTHA